MLITYVIEGCPTGMVVHVLVEPGSQVSGHEAWLESAVRRRVVQEVVVG